MRWMIALPLILWTPCSAVEAQFLDHLTNPTLPVTLQHPPGLGLSIDSIAFGPASGECSDEIVEALISDFVANQIEVIDRQHLDTLLAEHDLNLSGYVDTSQAAAIGKILGPSALIFIKSQRCTTEQDRFSETRSRYDRATKRKYNVRLYSARTRAFLKASIQTVDLTTGRVFAARVLDYSPEKTHESYDGYPEYPATFDVLDVAIHSAVTDVHRMFLSWSERIDLVFYNNKACGLQQAYQALRIGDLDRAFDLSHQNLDSCKTTPKVKAKVLGHAHYNVGMAYMMRHEYEEALGYFAEAARLRPGNIVTRAIADCHKAQDLMAAMQKVEERAAYEAERMEVESAKAEKIEIANSLTNSDVIRMVEQKLPDSIIVQKIKGSPCRFDTSTDALIALSDAGVTEQIILAMMEP